MSKRWILTIAIMIASQYAQGGMERVIANRQAGRTAVSLPADLPRVDGYAAAKECSEIGSVILLRPVGADRWDRLLVVDCAVRDDSDGTRTWMDRKGVIAEVDHETALRWGTVGKLIKVEVGLAVRGPRMER